ncbi:MAG: VWA domain-containing protein [bacterium]|nr:VWA domain-containing protein [bacterium]
MLKNTEKPNLFKQHLVVEKAPFVQKRAELKPGWDDEELHLSFYREDRDLYALHAFVPGISVGQQARILFQLLRSSRNGMEDESRKLSDRVIRLLLAMIPADTVLTVFLALRKTRANHKHTARHILLYILNHESLPAMVRERRAIVKDILEHALGKNTARGCAAKIAEGIEDTYVYGNILKHANDASAAKEAICYLYRNETADSKVPAASGIHYSELHELYKPAIESRETPQTITATNRGDIAATLVHIYRGGENPELLKALEEYVDLESGNHPSFDGSVALVLDSSASTRGSGEREFCILSQSVALQLLLARNCANLSVHPVGGEGFPPVPEGTTDLALPLLTVLEQKPDLAVIVSDGYENTLQGDLARVLQALPGTDVETQVVFCHSKFSMSDKLTLRRPVEGIIPEFEFWHQNDFEGLLPSLFMMASGEKGAAFTKKWFSERLVILEKEVQPWTN